MFSADRVSGALGVVAEPCNQKQRAITAGSVSGARGIFPFRFCRQTITETVLFAIERFANPVRVFPTHILNRKIRALEIAWIHRHHRFVLCLRHLKFAHLKRPGNGHSMSRLFFGVTIRISRRTAHHKGSRRNGYELHRWRSRWGPLYNGLAASASPAIL